MRSMRNLLLLLACAPLLDGDPNQHCTVLPAYLPAAQRLRQQLASDPYVEWWSLQFDPAAESRAHDHLSSLSYLPVMLQVRTCAGPCRL